MMRDTIHKIQSPLLLKVIVFFFLGESEKSKKAKGNCEKRENACHRNSSTMKIARYAERTYRNFQRERTYLFMFKLNIFKDFVKLSPRAMY